MDKEAQDTGEVTVYETSFLILPSISEEKLPEAAESIRKAISRAGAVEIDSEAPFKHPLAYQMSKTVGSKKYVANEAYIGWIKFEVDKTKIAEIESALKKMPEILRFLIVKAPRKTEFTFAKARAALQAKADKEREDKEAAEAEAAENVEEAKEAIME